VELQDRQGQFEQEGAALVVLGSLPESIDAATNKARSHGITYPIVYDAGTSVTRTLGLWSDRMEMPFMGYVIIAKSGRIVGGEQILSEAKDAAPENIDEILQALRQANAAEYSTPGNLGG